jgi:hypothetical protein
MLRMMRSRISLCGLTALIAVMAPGAALAGGFWLSVELPSAQSDARARGAALLVRPDGCFGPGARVSARAEGLVNGHRRSLPLRVIHVSTDAQGIPLYAIQRQWPREGVWVLTFTGTSRGPASNRSGYTATCRTLLELGPNGSIPSPASPDGNGPKRLNVRSLSPGTQEVEAALQALADKANRNAALTRAAR